MRDLPSDFLRNCMLPGSASKARKQFLAFDKQSHLANGADPTGLVHILVPGAASACRSACYLQRCQCAIPWCRTAGSHMAAGSSGHSLPLAWVHAAGKYVSLGVFVL